MVDFGCHAGHGRSRNISDALLWLQRFNATGSLVLGVDLHEDYTLDLQHRFDTIRPFSELRGVTKRVLQRAVSSRDGEVRNFKREVMMGITCCSGEWCKQWDKQDQRSHGADSDHYCRITRQRLNRSSSTLPLPPSKYPDFWQGMRIGKHRGLRYEVRTARIDSLWRNELQSRRIDFLKINIDVSWAHSGLEGLLQSRGFSVMVSVESGEKSESWCQ